MSVIETKVDTKSKEFIENARAMQAVVDELKAAIDIIKLGGSEKNRQRHTSRGKLMPRDRIAALIDPGSPFLEFSELAGYDLYKDETPAGGIITGIGSIHGREMHGYRQRRDGQRRVLSAGHRKKAPPRPVYRFTK